MNNKKISSNPLWQLLYSPPLVFPPKPKTYLFNPISARWPSNTYRSNWTNKKTSTQWLVLFKTYSPMANFKSSPISSSKGASSTRIWFHSMKYLHKTDKKIPKGEYFVYWEGTLKRCWWKLMARRLIFWIRVKGCIRTRGCRCNLWASSQFSLVKHKTSKTHMKVPQCRRTSFTNCCNP